MLDPFIIEEIMRKEQEKKEEQNRPTLSIEQSPFEDRKSPYDETSFDIEEDNTSFDIDDVIEKLRWDIT